MIFALFYVLYKRTEYSLWFHKSYKNCKSCKKKNVKEGSILFIRLKKNLTFFVQYIFIYIYLSIYILKKNRTFCVLLQRNEMFSRSFTFFAKEQKRTEHSFGFHKLPITQKKNRKEHCVL